MKEKLTTRKICILGLLTALTVILGMFATFRVGSLIKIPFKFITVFIVGFIYGPLSAGIVAAIADFLEALRLGVNPFITMVEFLGGVIFGICFYKAKENRAYYIRAVICALLQFIMSFTVMSFILEKMGIYASFRAAVLMRLPAMIILFALHLIVMCGGRKLVFRFKKQIMGSFKDYANSFQAKSRLGLESVGALCEKCGNPQKNLKFIHIAGTNGKGSVCAFLQCILTDSGMKVGKFISPNMIDVCERISIDGVNISQKEMEELLSSVEKAAKEVEREKGALPTQFEIWTAAAFIYFEKMHCDVVILETGLGGRLDATNIIDSPLMSIITKIDIDHIEYLGGTIEKIAFEKAGIIKKGSKVITTPNQAETVCSVLRENAEGKGAEFILAEKCENHRHDGMSEIFDLEQLKNLKINLAGLHQTENAALAVCAAEILGIDEKHIRTGLERARNIGRFEKLSDTPCVIFDGAHNLNGTKALVDALNRYFPDENFSIIYAAMADKDIDASLKHFKDNGFCERAQIFTVPVKDNPRAENPEKLAEKFKNFGFNVASYENIGRAYEDALKKQNIILICGSLYLYKDFTEYKKCNK